MQSNDQRISREEVEKRTAVQSSTIAATAVVINDLKDTRNYTQNQESKEVENFKTPYNSILNNLHISHCFRATKQYGHCAKPSKKKHTMKTVHIHICYHLYQKSCSVVTTLFPSQSLPFGRQNTAAKPCRELRFENLLPARPSPLSPPRCRSWKVWPFAASRVSVEAGLDRALAMKPSSGG